MLAKWQNIQYMLLFLTVRVQYYRCSTWTETTIPDSSVLGTVVKTEPGRTLAW